MTHVAQYVLTHGIVLLLGWILAQQAGAPIPSAPLLLIVGSLASSGRVNVASVMGASFVACLAADGFWLRLVNIELRSPADQRLDNPCAPHHQPACGWRVSTSKVHLLLESCCPSGRENRDCSGAVLNF